MLEREQLEAVVRDAVLAGWWDGFAVGLVVGGVVLALVAWVAWPGGGPRADD